MAPATQILLSGLLTFGVPLALAVRELIVVNRPRDEPPPDDRPPPQPKPMPPGGTYSGTLPDCLIPQRRPERALEPT